MATQAQKMKVGIFLVGCLAVLAGGFIAVSGYKSGEHTHYFIQFGESILGLNRGGLVVYNGVPVGKVSDITVSKARSVRVDIEVKDAEITLSPGVEAQLVMYSIATGTMTVSLSGGNPADGKLPAGSEIPCRPSLFASTAGNIPEIVKKISDIADKINTGLEGIEEGQIKGMLDGADSALQGARDVLSETTTTLKELRIKTVEGVDDTRKLIEEIRAEIRPFTENTNALVKSADSTLTTINEKITPLDFSKIEGELLNTLTSIRELADAARKTTGQLETVTKTVVYETGNVEFMVRQTTDSLQETLEALRALADTLRRDPSAVVYGPAHPKGEK
ncbi:MAG: MlaD family protein [Candidatus Hydrogenedentales bacterium]